MFKKVSPIVIRFEKLTFFIFVLNKLFFRQRVFSLIHYNSDYSLFDFFFLYVLRVLSRFGFCNFALYLSRRKKIF